MKLVYKKYDEGFVLLNKERSSLGELVAAAKAAGPNGFVKTGMEPMTVFIYCRNEDRLKELLEAHKEELHERPVASFHPRIFTVTFTRGRRFQSVFMAFKEVGMRAIHSSENIIEVLEEEGEVTIVDRDGLPPRYMRPEGQGAGAPARGRRNRRGGAATRVVAPPVARAEEGGASAAEEEEEKQEEDRVPSNQLHIEEGGVEENAAEKDFMQMEVEKPKDGDEEAQCDHEEERLIKKESLRKARSEDMASSRSSVNTEGALLKVPRKYRDLFGKFYQCLKDHEGAFPEGFTTLRDVADCVSFAVNRYDVDGLEIVKAFGGKKNKILLLLSKLQVKYLAKQRAARARANNETV